MSTLSLLNKQLIIKLIVVVVLMFGFGYALVPLYDLLCKITGIGGKTGQIEQTVAEASKADLERFITVEFTGMTASGLPWDFKPEKKQIEVHPGQLNEVVYIAENKSSREVVGQAIPSVTPGLASKYFNKTECFCFTQQTLLAHEKKPMMVKFIIDPKLPKEIHTITLSYSFFNADKYSAN